MPTEPVATALEGFKEPDWDAPIDLAAYLAEVPPDANAKGMFFEAFISETRRIAGHAPGRDRYVAFKDYSASEYLETLVECAQVAYPSLPLRQALRRLGRTIYPAFVESLIGRVLFKFAGNNVGLALRAVPRAYRATSNVATAEVEMLDESSAIVKLRGVWDVADAFQVGVFEGGIKSLGHESKILVRPLSLGDVDLNLRWWLEHEERA